MSLPKVLMFVVFLLVITIGVGTFLKSGKTNDSENQTEVEITQIVPTPSPLEVELSEEEPKEAIPDIIQPEPIEAVVVEESPKEIKEVIPLASVPTADRVNEFFNKTPPKFPIVETITYQSRVEWQKGRPAWLSDYASHYQTSRHFIARSLNNKPDYFKQDIADGKRFNVLKLDKKINFYLLVDATRLKLWFYYLDLDTNERTLVKTYDVGIGRLANDKKSGMLTPLGKYSIGDKIAIYKPKMTGIHNGQKVELMRVFGTRWIPFDKEIRNTTAQAKGLGLHGAPWMENDKGDFVQNTSSIGKHDTDGCICLSTDDMEELFAIIITKPTTIELVKDFYDAELPGKELALSPKN